MTKQQPHTSTYPLTLEASASVVRAYMRMAHGVALEEFDLEKLARLLASASTGTHEVALDKSLEIEILEVVAPTSVQLTIPKGWPLLAPDKPGAAHVAAYIAGRPRVGQKFADLEEMATSVDITRWVRMSKKVTDKLVVGMKVTLEELSGESTTPVPPDVAKAREVRESHRLATVKRAQAIAHEVVKPKKVVKPTRTQLRVADHLEGRCFCDKPQGHMCPAVREGMLES